MIVTAAELFAHTVCVPAKMIVMNAELLHTRCVSTKMVVISAELLHTRSPTILAATQEDSKVPVSECAPLVPEIMQEI